MVEHLVYTERVGGSSPSLPTIARSVAALVLSTALAVISWTPAVADSRSPMRFRVETPPTLGCGAKCNSIVVAEGVIEPETPGDFLAFVDREHLTPASHSLMYIDSPGGNVVAAMELGEEFRRYRLSAVVASASSGGEFAARAAGQCVSACVYALMGAVRRVAPLSSHVALHRMSAEAETPTSDGRVYADQRLVGIVARYARHMGVSPRIVLMAESLPPDEIRALAPSEMQRAGLAKSRD